MHSASMIGIGMSVALVILACYLKYFRSKQAKKKLTNNQEPTNLAVVNSRQTSAHQQPAYPTLGYPTDFETQASFLTTTTSSRY